MPSREALRLCPQAIFIRPNIAKYSEVGRQVRQIMHRYTDLVEPMSIDEAYLDLSGRGAIAVGRALKEAIQSELRLTASVGVSYCKFLAKMASDMEKPNGFTVITWERAQTLLPTLPVRRIYGVGPAGEQALRALGINTCGDLINYDPEVLRKHFGRRADELTLLARGIDTRPVITTHETKSIGEENTFAVDQSDRAYLSDQLTAYAANLASQLHRQQLAARTVTVKIKWNLFIEGGPKGGDFQQITRSQTLAMPTNDAQEIGRAAREIFARIEFEGRKVRLLGLSVHNFVHRGELIQARLPI